MQPGSRCGRCMRDLASWAVAAAGVLFPGGSDFVWRRRLIRFGGVGV